MWYLYILYSESADRYYIGHSRNPSDELQRHNLGANRITQKDKPWRLVHVENYPTEQAAARRKVEIKRKKSRDYIEEIIKLDY
jgi:putative endonuclease